MIVNLATNKKTLLYFGFIPRMKYIGFWLFFFFFFSFLASVFFFFFQICEVGEFNIDHAQEDLAKFG